MLKYPEQFVVRVLMKAGVLGRDDMTRLRVQLEKRAQLATAEAKAAGEDRAAQLRSELEQRVAEAGAIGEDRAAQLRSELEQRVAEVGAIGEDRAAQLRSELEQQVADVRGGSESGLARMRTEMEQRLAEAVAGLTARMESQIAAVRAQAQPSHWVMPDVTLHGMLGDRAEVVQPEVAPFQAGGGLTLAQGDWTAPLDMAFAAGTAAADALMQALSDLGHRVTTRRGHGGSVPAPLSAFPRARIGTEAGAPEILIGFDWGDTGFPLEAVDWLNANVAAVACATTHAEKVLRDHGCTVPLATVGAGVAGWEHLTRDRAYRAPGKGFRFLHVSACGPDQALGTLLDAFGQVFALDDDVSLLIRPTGGTAEALRADVAERRRFNPSYPDVVVVEGALSETQLKALYGQCHVFVSAGRAEGFAREIAQAFLSGLPVVATGWGGHLDYCSGETAWLVDYEFARARSPAGVLASAWADPLPKALEEGLWFAYRADPAERFSKAWTGRRVLIERYGWKEIALRVAQLAAAVGVRAEVRPAGPVGFVTSWNSKCGIASYMGHMLERVEPADYVVFADRWSTPLGVDASNCLRVWTQGPLTPNSLGDILPQLSICGVESLVIQFNFGFYNPAEFRGLVEGALAQGVPVVVELHSTVDPPQAVLPIKLADYADALRQCMRVLAHSPADMNRLKAVGVVDNVTLFPLSVVAAKYDLRPWGLGDVPVIASFGFALPNKGLPQLVTAINLLKQKGTPARLKMWNAEYPHPISRQELDSIRSAIENHGLQDLVEVHSEYLDDAECLRLLSEADLIVNSYQSTGESSSAAVRFALASRSPVMVTPLPIFDELDGAVFRSAGVSARHLANGIAEALNNLRDGTVQARKIQAESSRWVDQHSVERQGSRLMQVARSTAVPLQLHRGS